MVIATKVGGEIFPSVHMHVFTVDNEHIRYSPQTKYNTYMMIDKVQCHVVLVEPVATMSSDSKVSHSHIKGNSVLKACWADIL